MKTDELTEFYDPELYDLEVGVSYGRAARWAEYAALAEATGGPVLELGTGTGQVLVAIAARGIDVVGLDRSSEMLAAAEARVALLTDGVRHRVELVAGDMRNFELPQRFAAVFIPYHALFHLLTIEDLHACLRCAWRHLRPNGILAFDVFLLSAGGWSSFQSETGFTRTRLVGEAEWPSRRAVVRVYEEASYDALNQRLRMDYRYELLDPNRVVRETLYRHLQYRVASPDELTMHLSMVGFGDIQCRVIPGLSIGDRLISGVRLSEIERKWGTASE